METWLTAFSSLGHAQSRSLHGERAVVPDGASSGDVGYGDLANSLLQSRGMLRGGPSRGRGLFFLMEPVVVAGDVGYGDLATVAYSLLQPRACLK